MKIRNWCNVRIFHLVMLVGISGLLSSLSGCDSKNQNPPVNRKQVTDRNHDRSKQSAFEECMQSGTRCSEVKMELDNADVAYEKGCQSKDYYSCYRLGQYYEFHRPNTEQALKFYKISCEGKDKYGCEADYQIHMKLCFDENKTDFCGLREPEGEYKIFAYLKDFDKKYKYSLRDYNFSYKFQNDNLQKLFEKRMQEKNLKLLLALEDARKGKFYDGDGSETLESYIRVMRDGQAKKQVK